jgi:hypothetical protein
LQPDQMRRFRAAGLAPGRIKIQHDDLPLEIRKPHPLTVCERPPKGADPRRSWQGLVCAGRRICGRDSLLPARAAGGQQHGNQRQRENLCVLLFHLALAIQLVMVGLSKLVDPGRIDLWPGHAVFLVGPLAEIDQLAALRTKRPPGIVLPFNRLSARRTFRHKAKVRSKQRKVKHGAVTQPRGRAQNSILVNSIALPGVE